ncbi:hypothetical protein RI367_003469 [Sorochytrium milnesiophthora]
MDNAAAFEDAQTMDQPFDFAHPPPFAPWQYAGVAAFTVILGWGAVFNSFVAYTLIKNRSAFSNNVHMVLTTALNLIDCIPPVLLVFFQVAKLGFGSYGLGYWGCQLEGFLLSFGLDSALIMIIVIAAERFCVVVKGIHKPWTFWRWVVLVVVLFTLVSKLMPLFGSAVPFAVRPSGTYCLYDLTRVNGKPRHSQSANLILTPAVLVIVVCLYATIYRHASKVMQSTARTSKQTAQDSPLASATQSKEGSSTLPTTTAADTMHSPNGATPASSSAEKAPLGDEPLTSQPSMSAKHEWSAASLSIKTQRQVFRVSVAITTGFFIMVVPYLVYIAVYTSGVKTPQWTDILTECFSLTNLMTDAAIVCTLNPLARRLVLEQLGEIRGRSPQASSSAA